MDTKNERITGASVELEGVNKVFYSNISGYCYIPKYLLAKTHKVTVNSISYKTVQMNPDDLDSRIILKSR